MASLIFSPLRFTCTSSNFRFPFSGPRIRVCISPSRRVWTRSSKSMSKSAGQESLPSQDQDGVKTENSDVLVQYVVLRRDLIDTWPLGSVVTQGCHASVCAIWSHKDDPHTVDYCSAQNIDSMHKVTLEVKGEPQILNLSDKLTTAGITHKLWIEQPENIPTCLATKPYLKSVVSSFFKKLKLYGAVEFALGFEVQRHKAEPPLALDVHSLYDPSTVRTRPRCWLPRRNPLILVANKHQTHPSSSSSSSFFKLSGLYYVEN